MQRVQLGGPKVKFINRDGVVIRNLRKKQQMLVMCNANASHHCPTRDLSKDPKTIPCL